LLPRRRRRRCGANNLKRKSQTGTCDFERGLLKAVSSQLLSGSIDNFVACAFHFKQAIKRYIVTNCPIPSKYLWLLLRPDGFLDMLCCVPISQLSTAIKWIQDQMPPQAFAPTAATVADVNAEQKALIAKRGLVAKVLDIFHPHVD
jgi:hypothetical protein